MQNTGDQDKKERQLDNLTNLVENHTRTKRHLEQYSEIGDPAFKNMAREKQEKREENIDIMIDDSYEHCKKISERKIQAIYLKDAPSYDLENEYTKVLYNWGEIYRYIKEITK